MLQQRLLKAPLNADALTFYAELNQEKEEILPHSFVGRHSCLIKNGQQIRQSSCGNIFIYLISRFPVS